MIKIFDLIHSSLMADIIVVGTQQRMLPKLIANYYDLDNPVIMIVLYKKEKMPNLGENLSLLDKAKLIPVNLNHYDIEDVVSIVKNHLKQRARIT